MKIKFKLHWSFVLLALGLVYFGKALTFLCYLVAVILHELGHAFVGKKLGYKLNVITLMPYGASLSGTNSNISPKHEMPIVLAGPMVNLLLCALSCLISLFLGKSTSFLTLFYNANMSTLLFNILPIFPLDGGRALLFLLSTKLQKAKALKITKFVGGSVCFVFIVLFVTSYFYSLNYMLGINSLFLLISLLEDNNLIYYKKIDELGGENPQKKVKLYEIYENETLINVYKIIDKQCVCKIAILDYKKNVLKIITDNDIKNRLFKSEYTKTLRSAFMNN